MPKPLKETLPCKCVVVWKALGILPCARRRHEMKQRRKRVELWL
jgi:hypothetical protein